MHNHNTPTLILALTLLFVATNVAWLVAYTKKKIPDATPTIYVTQLQSQEPAPKTDEITSGGIFAADLASHVQDPEDCNELYTKKCQDIEEKNWLTQNQCNRLQIICTEVITKALQ